MFIFSALFAISTAGITHRPLEVTPQGTVSVALSSSRQLTGVHQPLVFMCQSPSGFFL